MKRILILFCLAGCTQTDVAARILSSEDGPGPDGGGHDGKNADFCASRGPILLVGDSPGTSVCGGQVAERIFRFALCTCADYTGSHSLTTDSFDSAQGPYLAGGRGGSVGMNGRVTASGPLKIGGSFWASDPLGIQLGANAPLEVNGEIRSGGPLVSESRVAVDADLLVGGPIAASELTVGGALRLPPSAQIDVSGSLRVAETLRAVIAVPPPCDCTPEALTDVVGFVTRHASNNDNETIGLDPSDLANLGGATRLELPCGRFYIDRIGGAGTLTLTVSGRTALFVGADINLENELLVEVLAGAELDLFVSGTIVSARRLMLGSADRPATVRLYVGGAGTLQLSGGALIAGNVYAPLAELTSSAPIEVFGALMVRRLATSAAVTVHYDTAVLRAADDCPAPPSPTCDSCRD